VDPLGKGFQMSGHPVDGAVRPFFRAVDFYGVLQGKEKIAACSRRLGRAQGVAELLPEKIQEQGQIPPLLFLRARRGGHLGGKIDRRPLMQIVSDFAGGKCKFVRWCYLYGFFAHLSWLQEGYFNILRHLRYLLWRDL